MVAVVARMLEHGGLEFALRISGSGGMLLESGLSGAFRLTHICAWARGVVGTSARYVVYEAVRLFLFQLVLGLDKRLSEGSACGDGVGIVE